VDESEIEAVRTVLRSGLNAEPWPYLNVGSHIHMDRGPLAGLEGIVSNQDKVDRLVVSITLLQRSVAVEIDRDWVRPVTSVMSPRPSAIVEPSAYRATL
jgi:transcription antitermination factor NusG